MKLLHIYLGLLTILIFSSCEIENTIHFNEDFSGSSESTVNFEPFLEFAKISASDDEINEIEDFLQVFNKEERPDSISYFIDSIQLQLQDDGLKNFSIDLIDSVTVGVFLEFDNLDAISGKNSMDILSEALSNEEDQTLTELQEVNSFMKNSPLYELNGNRLKINVGGMDYDELMTDFLEKENINFSTMTEEEQKQYREEKEAYVFYSIKMMGEFMKFKQTYTFDKKVKDVECNLPVDVSKHKIEIAYTLSELVDLLKEDNEVILQVKLQ